jgi:predicted signal transduction protein with EAL and GGDEF domain
VIPSLVYLAAVALLRQASGGASGGSGTLVLLPVVWMALYGSRGQLGAVIAGIAAVWIGPLVAIGAPLYPATGWRGCVLVVCLSAMIGTTVQRLVANVRAREGERERLLGRLRQLALSDPLTGLPNRRAWDEGLARVLADRTRPEAVSLALPDLDQFKALNDNLGHEGRRPGTA